MLYSEIKERENRFFLSLKIAIPFFFFLLFIFFIITNIDMKTFLQNNIIAFLIIFFIYVYYILYQIYMGFKTSMIDSITKAFSREHILKIIDKKMKKKRFLIVGIKIKNIMDINERYGIKKTDEILRFLVEKLNNFLIKKEYKNIPIGHIIGGNFIFLLDCDKKKINHIIKQFINQIENNNEENIYLKLIFSFVCSDSQNSADDILISLFEQFELDSKNRRNGKRLKLKVNEFERLIIDLIEKKEFDFRFQPVKNINNLKIEIYEVLIKLNSDKYGKISQKDFISVINRIGYENIFDEILIEEILKIYYLLDKKVKLSVNISLYSIENSNFLNNIKKLIKNYGKIEKNIILDISGNSYIDDTIKLNENIKILRNMGFLVAIDNFGGDNNSFNYMKNINFDIVKFDIEYSKNYKDRKKMDILKAFIYIFKDLNIKSVIKFIENEESYQFFKSLEIDYIQGYIVGKPINLKQLRSNL